MTDASKYKRIDWPAVQRDYRPGNLTQQELAAKHKLNEATLCRKIKADRAKDPSAWPQDLTELVKQATDARLMAELVKDVAKDGQEQAKTTVLAAAELNAQVILRHRKDIAAANTLAMDMLHELATATHSPEKLAALFETLQPDMSDEELQSARNSFGNLLKLGNRVGSLQKLADTLTKVQVLERKALGLDDINGADRGTPRGARAAHEMTDDDLASIAAGSGARASATAQSPAGSTSVH
ncbi:MAG: hypothetical protein RIQ53_2253 [Pseudomonadota bacterium]